jgi:guanine deaminase
MNNHELFMHQAIRISLENVKSRIGGPFGALIVLNGTVIARGTNLVTGSCDPTAHAEIVAIRAAGAKLRTFLLADCVLYSSCEPCPMCFGAIYWARIKQVYYAATRYDAAQAGFDDSFIYEQLAMEQPLRMVRFSQILHEDAREVFDVWNGADYKIPY